MIIFSGVDGAGKTTQIDRLTATLERNGRMVVYMWARGGYTPGFELFKNILRKLFRKKLPLSGRNSSREKSLARPYVANIWLSLAIIDLLLYWGVYSRYQNIRGRIVICDRYIDDTLLDFKKNFPNIRFEQWWIWRLLIWFIPTPDASFLLWIPVVDSRKRSLQKEEPYPDDESTLKYRLDAYLDEKLFSQERYIRIDGRSPEESIMHDICKIIIDINPALSDMYKTL